jgi:hypothetical protein
MRNMKVILSAKYAVQYKMWISKRKGITLDSPHLTSFRLYLNRLVRGMKWPLRRRSSSISNKRSCRHFSRVVRPFLLVEYFKICGLWNVTSCSLADRYWGTCCIVRVTRRWRAKIDLKCWYFSRSSRQYVASKHVYLPDCIALRRRSP